MATVVTSTIIESSAAISLQPQTSQKRAGWLAFLSARISLGVTLLAAPLAFGAVQTWSWISLTVVAVLLLWLWGIACVQQKVLKVAWSPLYLPAALFLVFSAVQFFLHLTPDPIATREALLKLVTDMIFFFLAGQLFPSGPEKAWHGLGFTILIYAFLLSLFAIVQFFSSPGLIYWSVRPRWGGWIFGPYVNHNHYAGLMELLIPIATGYALSRPQGDPARGLLGFAVLLPVASVLLSGSRGGFVALLVQSSILLVILAGPALRPRRPALVPAVILGMTVAALGFFLMDTGEISRRLATVFQLKHQPSVEVGFEERRTLTLDCLKILRDYPWGGVGLGSFELVYPHYQTLPSDDVWGHAHNDYAEALAETGLVGGILIIWALAVFFLLAFGSVRRRLKHQIGWIQFGAALGCCGLLVHSLFDFNLHIPANAAWFAVCAAVAARLHIASWGTLGG